MVENCLTEWIVVGQGATLWMEEELDLMSSLAQSTDSEDKMRIRRS